MEIVRYPMLEILIDYLIEFTIQQEDIPYMYSPRLPSC